MNETMGASGAGVPRASVLVGWLAGGLGTAELAGPAGLRASARLVGVGISPDGLVLTPSLHDFGSVVLGSPRPTQRVTLTNHAMVTTGALTVALSGTGAGELTVAHACTTLAAGASCSIDVTLAPCGSDCTDLYAHNAVVSLHAGTTNGSSSHSSSWGGACAGSFSPSNSGVMTAVDSSAGASACIAFASS
jgi:hypothetical protein